MLNPNATPTPPTPPRVPLIDSRTGLIDRAWYMFFVSLMNAAQLTYNGDVGPSAESLIASYDAALQALAQNVDTQPLPVDLSAELTRQIEAAGLTNFATGLLSQIAEMQKQLEALNLLPPPSQGTVVAVTGTAPVMSSGGIAPNISMAAASASTDGYLTSIDWNTFNNKAPATSGTSILYGNGSGGFNNVSLGSGVSFVAGVLSATGSGGTITSVTATAPIASSGGFTPNISINAAYGDTINPYAAKTANYVLAAPDGIAGVPTFRALVAADIPSLPYVTSVSGAAPVVSSGGTTPTISMAAATTSINGYLTSTDWNTFNNKQTLLVSGTNIKTVNGASLLGSGDLGPITATYGGTDQTTVTTGDLLYGSATNTWSRLADVAIGNALISGGVGVAPSYGKIGLTTHVSGTLPTANGGTNLTSFTANGVVYASSTSALATGTKLIFDGTNLGVGASPSTPLTVKAQASDNISLRVLQSTNAAGTIQFTDDPVTTEWGSILATSTYFQTASAGYTRFLTAGSERARIDASGNVGIGTNSPTAPLDVNGNVAITGSARRITGDFSNATIANRTMFQNSNTNTSTIIHAIPNGTATTGGFEADNASNPTNASALQLFSQASETTIRSAIRGTGTYLPMTFYTGGNERVRIDTGGIVTMSAYGAGTATFSAAGVISSVSDESWKIKDGVPVDPNAMIKKLQPGYWYYNEEKQKSFGKERQLGFYAQNVNAAIGPEAAPEPKEGKPWGYYDRSVLAVVVLSLQNALDTIDSLTARIAALEQK